MEQTDLLRYAAETLRRLDIRYAVVGSFASSAWGEARLTHDIDVLVELPTAQVPGLCAAFPATDFYVSKSAAED